MSRKSSTIICLLFLILFPIQYTFSPVHSLTLYSYRFVGNENETWIPINSSFHFNIRMWAQSPNVYFDSENMSKWGISAENKMDGTWMVAMQSGLCYEDYINDNQHLLLTVGEGSERTSATPIEAAFQYNTLNPYYNENYNIWEDYDYEQYEIVALFNENTTLLQLPNTDIDRKMPNWTYEQWIKRMYIAMCGEDVFSNESDPDHLDPFYDHLAYSEIYMENIELRINDSIYMVYPVNKTDEYRLRRNISYTYSQIQNSSIDNINYTFTRMYADGGIPNKDWVIPYSYDNRYTDTIIERNQYYMNDTDINRDSSLIDEEGNFKDSDYGYFTNGTYIYYGGEYGIWENGETLEFTSPRLTEGYYSFLIQFAEFNEEGIIENPKLNIIVWVNVTDLPKPIAAWIYDVIAFICVFGIVIVIYRIFPRTKNIIKKKMLDGKIISPTSDPTICYGGKNECWLDEYDRPTIAVPGTQPCKCVLDTQENRDLFYVKPSSLLNEKNK